jgi:hypothetical protein
VFEHFEKTNIQTNKQTKTTTTAVIINTLKMWMLLFGSVRIFFEKFT